MTYDEYKKHLEACGPLDDISKGLLSAFEIGYGQGIKDGKTHFTKALAEPEQEPVAWLTRRTGDGGAYVDGYESCEPTDYGAFPVYTAPPKREWKGLTSDDKHFLLANAWNKEQAFDDFMEAIDKFLEEKNT